MTPFHQLLRPKTLAFFVVNGGVSSPCGIDLYTFCGSLMVKSLRVSLEWSGCPYDFTIEHSQRHLGLVGAEI